MRTCSQCSGATALPRCRQSVCASCPCSCTSHSSFHANKRRVQLEQFSLQQLNRIAAANVAPKHGESDLPRDIESIDNEFDEFAGDFDDCNASQDGACDADFSLPIHIRLSELMRHDTHSVVLPGDVYVVPAVNDDVSKILRISSASIAPSFVIRKVVKTSSAACLYVAVYWCSCMSSAYNEHARRVMSSRAEVLCSDMPDIDDACLHAR